jgi:hypothetical protein
MTQVETSQTVGRTDNNPEHQAIIEFTTVSDDARHRHRYVKCEEGDQLRRIHEIKTDRDWRRVGSQLVDRLKVNRVEPESDRTAQEPMP